MPHLHEQLFSHAVDLLSEYEDQEQNDKDRTLVKDAQVAMSCVLNTMSPRVVQHFVNNGENDVIIRIKDRAAISNFEQHECLSLLPRYLQALLDHDVQYLARLLIQDRYNLQESYELDEPPPNNLKIQDKVLEILQYLCQVVNNPPFDIKNPSENDALIAAEFGELSDAGRKVDLLFVHEGIELSNLEFKKPNTSMANITVQCRKNIRLGRYLQEQHRRYGIQEPSVIMVDVAEELTRGDTPRTPRMASL